MQRRWEDALLQQVMVWCISFHSLFIIKEKNILLGLHSVSQTTSGRANILITAPLVNWKDAVCDLSAHSSHEYHLSSEAWMDAFIRTMENPSSQIDASISQQAVDTVMQNKAILISIIKCLEFCGRNDIAIRGHQPCLDSDKFDMTQKGKYKALPKFCVDAGDEVLKKHLEGASKHKQYISKTSQNALLECMGEYMRQQIAADVQSSKFFAVIADEVAAARNWEQFGIVLHYIKNGQALERLAGFVALDWVRDSDLSNNQEFSCWARNWH